MNINQFIKGIIIGIAKIIPGLSGAVLMISFNLYDKAIDSITNFFSNPKKNFIFLFNLSFGIIIGIMLFSKILHFLITNYYLYTTSLFLGLILGGVPIINKNIPKKEKYYLLSLVSFSLVFSLSFFTTTKDYILKNTYIDYIAFFIAGIFESIGTILPGVSSTALLMLIGMYNHYLVVLSGLLNIKYIIETLEFIIPFTLGMVIGIIMLSILINYLFKKVPNQTFSIILGISLSSIFMLAKNIIPYFNSILSIIISIFFLIIGYLITNKLK